MLFRSWREMPLPRPQGAVAVAEVGAEVTVQQQRPARRHAQGASKGDIMAQGCKPGYGSDLESELGLVTSPLTPWRAMTSPCWP